MRLPDSFTNSHDILNTDVEVVQAWGAWYFLSRVITKSKLHQSFRTGSQCFACIVQPMEGLRATVG